MSVSTGGDFLRMLEDCAILGQATEKLDVVIGIQMLTTQVAEKNTTHYAWKQNPFGGNQLCGSPGSLHSLMKKHTIP